VARSLACFGRRYPSCRYEVSDEDAHVVGVHLPDELLEAFVHGAQQFEYHRPVRVGDVLICSPSIVNVAAHGRSEILTAQLECTDASTGAPVLTARSTIVLFTQDA
jgi:acyl-CoA thioesterase FadM